MRASESSGGMSADGMSAGGKSAGAKSAALRSHYEQALKKMSAKISDMLHDGSEQNKSLGTPVSKRKGAAEEHLQQRAWTQDAGASRSPCSGLLSQ